MITHTFKNLSFALFCFTLSGCATHYGASHIVSTPPGAEVINIDDNSVIGVTPLTYWWKNNNGTRKVIPLRLKKAGYYEKVSSFWLSMRHKNQSAALQAPNLVEISMEKIGG